MFYSLCFCKSTSDILPLFLDAQSPLLFLYHHVSYESLCPRKKKFLNMFPQTTGNSVQKESQHPTYKRYCEVFLIDGCRKQMVKQVSDSLSVLGKRCDRYLARDKNMAPCDNLKPCKQECKYCHCIFSSHTGMLCLPFLTSALFVSSPWLWEQVLRLILFLSQIAKNSIITIPQRKSTWQMCCLIHAEEPLTLFHSLIYPGCGFKPFCIN